MMGFALGVAAALCWAGLDVVRKALAGKASPTALAVFLLLGQMPFLGAWAAYDQTWITDQHYWPPAVASMTMNALANVLFMRSVQLSPLSRTVPFLSLTPVISALAAIPLLGEVPGSMHWAGISLVVVGALVLNSDLADSWWRSVSHEKGAPFMIAVAVLWALSTALDKRALPHASPASHAFLLSSGSATILVSWILSRGKHGELRQVAAAPKGLLVGLIAFAVAALALQMVALQWLWVAVLETLKRAFGVVGSVLLGRVIFGEPITGPKLAAMALMVAGTTLLAFT
ncbi:MAG: DMT family transporter [Deltaproteobacteria bacterium]|nr:DMT family transporter [Deltaproteobacteria bacterium]MBW2628251.1 DMT family transporter [Deltaproteobacteria bacterium]